jgi:hypothetical protein
MAPWLEKLNLLLEAPEKLYSRVKEGILRTPAKRKREAEEPEAMQEDRPAKRGPAVEVAPC